MVVAALESSVVPEQSVGQYFPIIVEVLLESIVGVSSPELDLDVLLILFGVRRVDLGVLGAREGLEQVVGQRLRVIEGCLEVCVELFGEGIAVVDAEDAFEEVDVDRNVDVLPGVVIR